MAILSESVSKSKSWSVWAGSEQDFRRILRTIQQQFGPLMPDHVEKQTAYRRQRLQQSEARLAEHTAELARTKATDGMHDYYKQSVDEDTASVELQRKELAEEEEQARLENQIQLTVTGKAGETRRVTASADELSEYLGGRSFDSLEFSAPSGRIDRFSINLVATRTEGMRLRVTSNDAKWSLSTFAELEGIIDERVPAWRIVRSLWLLMPLYLVSPLIALWLVLDAIANFTTPAGIYEGGAAFVAGMLWVFLSVGSTFVGISLTLRLVPAFEIVPAGQKYKGSAFVGVFGSTLGAILVGFLVNLLSTGLISS